MVKSMRCATCNKYFDMRHMSTIDQCLTCEAHLFFSAKFQGEDMSFSFSQLPEVIEHPIPDPIEVKEYLDRFVVGQEDLKKALSVVAVNHMYAVDHNKTRHNIKIKTPAILITGSTGSGKTLTVSYLAKMFDIPFISVDCTTITSAGYVGRNLEEIFEPVIKKYRGNNWDGNMIVYFDEIDKIAASKDERGKDVNGKAVQQAMLKLLEGETVYLETKTSNYEFDTRNVLFIFSGAFTETREALNKKAKQAPLGFEVKNTRKHYKITSKDLIEAGMIRELIGRISLIVETQELGKEELLRVLTEPENCLLKEYNMLCEIRDLDPIDETLDLEEIVDLCIERKVGARGLRQIIEEKLLEHMYNDTNGA